MTAVSERQGRFASSTYHAHGFFTIEEWKRPKNGATGQWVLIVLLKALQVTSGVAVVMAVCLGFGNQFYGPIYDGLAIAKPFILHYEVAILASIAAGVFAAFGLVRIFCKGVRAEVLCAVVFVCGGALGSLSKRFYSRRVNAACLASSSARKNGRGPRVINRRLSKPVTSAFIFGTPTAMESTIQAPTRQR